MANAGGSGRGGGPGGDRERDDNSKDGGPIFPPKYLIVTDDGMDRKWNQWLQQFEFWATSVDFEKTSAVKQVAQFMTTIGPDGIVIYNDFNLTPAQKTNDLRAIKDKFTEYFGAKTSVTFERHLLYSIRQDEGQNAQSFFSRIKTQAAKCEFTATDDFIRDQIVIGMRDLTLQKQLFEITDLTRTEAENKCRIAEVTERQFQRIHHQEQAKIAAVDSQESTKAERQKKSQKPFLCKRCDTKHVYLFYLFVPNKVLLQTSLYIIVLVLFYNWLILARNTVAENIIIKHNIASEFEILILNFFVSRSI